MPRHHASPPLSPVAAAAPDRAAAATALSAAVSAAPALFRRWHWVALVGILLLAAALRVHDLRLNSLWIDELYSLEFSAGNCYVDAQLPRNQLVVRPPAATHLDAPGTPSAARLWFTINNDQHPPLYYLTLRLWRDLFGSSDAAIRALSILASLVAIVLLVDLGRLLFNPSAGLWAGLLMALSHPQIWYAQEARSYTLLEAWFLGACCALVRIERLGLTPRRAAALGACLLGTMLTHYFGAAGCLALGLYTLIRLRGAERTRTIGVMLAAAAIYAVIWGPFVYHQTHGLAYASTWLDDPDPGFLARWAARVTSAPIRLFSTPLTKDALTGGIAGMLLLLIPFPMLRRRPALLLPTMCAVSWIALPAVLDLLRHTLQMHHERYFLTAGPALYLVAAGLLPDDTRRRITPHLLPAAMALYCVLSLPWVYVVHKSDWRALGQAAAANVRPGDLVIFDSPYTGTWYSGVLYLAVDHYAPGATTLAYFHDGDRPAPPDVLAAARAARAVWLAADPTVTDVSTYLPGFAITERHFAWDCGSFCRLRPASTPATTQAAPPEKGGRP